MPAISPARLQRETGALFEHIEDLDAFMSALTHLLEAYADRTVRPARSGRPASLLPAFHAPRPVLRKLAAGLSAFAVQDDPEPVFDLAERLWARNESEFKHLAVGLLGSIPAEHRARVSACVQRWLPGTGDEGLLEALFAVGITADFKGILDLVESELEGDPEVQDLALNHLQAIIRSADEATLPGIFRLLRRVMDHSRIAGSSRMLALARSLSARVPVETAFFLRQQYLVALRPAYARLIRQCMDAFPGHVQEDLRRMLRENPVD